MTGKLFSIRCLTAGMPILGWSLACSDAGPEVVLLNQVDFEGGDLAQIERLNQQKGTQDAIILVSEPVRAGKFAAKTRLRLSDPTAAIKP